MSRFDEREKRRTQSVAASIAGINDPLAQMQTEEIPSSVVVVKKKSEKRTRRKQIVLKPSIHDMAELKCKELGMSMNEVVNQLLEIWIKA